MPRVATAVFVCGVGLCLFAGVPVAGASTLLLAQAAAIEKTENPAVKPSGARPGSGTIEKSSRAPARQVPVEPVETSGDEDDKPDGDAGAEPGGKIIKDFGQMPPVMEGAARPSGTVKETATAGPPARQAVMRPGLPVRKPSKPPKPIVKRKPGAGNSAKKSPSSRTARDKKLCRVLQSCRNGFVKCKTKIKHPDQSEAWIIAKEECGAHYKACVEKDFRAGEWAFTRWFYFQELQCD